MHQSPPPGVHPHNIPPHLYRNSGTFFNGPTQPQGLGLFSRIKNSLSAAGSAITNAFESGAEEESTSQYAARSGQFPPGSLSAYSDRRFSDNGHIPGDRAPHVPPQDRGNFAGYQGPAGREPTTFPPGFGSSPKSSQEPANEGLFGKMRHFLSSDERSQQQSASPPPGGHMYRPPAMTREPQYMPQLPPQHQQQQQQHQYQQLHQHQQPPDFAQPEGANAPPVPQGYPGNVFGAQSTAPQYPPQHPSQAQSQSQPAFPSHPVQETHGAAAFQPAPLSMHQGSPSFPPHGNNAYAPPASAPATPADPYEWLNDVPSEPQVLIHEDSVVFIMKPKEFHRKKFDMAQAGPGALQVFSDFERVFTRFKTPDGSRAFTTEELMEASGVISAEGIADMQRAVDEMERGLLAAAAADSLRVEEVTDRDDFASENEAADDAANGDATYEVYESGARQYHQALATKGNVPLAYVYPAVRARLGTLGLRDQWKDPMQMLLARSVPFYVFSSGLGDIVTCALAAAGLPTPTAADVHGGGGGGAAAAGALPNNVRVISNFFRTAPDGTIRAFTQPTIHDRNKNATTAARLMGMPVPQRPHALVLAAHEDDAARMTDGVQGLQQTLSIGYMEVADDLPQRLPVFLNSFDAVIVGDGSFKFVASVLEDILRTPIPSKAATAHPASGLAGKLPSLGFGLRRGLDGGGGGGGL
eukprot:gene9723-6959_t